MNLSLIMLKTDNCPVCKKAQDAIESNPVLKKNIKIVSAYSKEGNDLVKKNNLESVPSFVDANGVVMQGLPRDTREFCSLLKDPNDQSQCESTLKYEDK